MDDVSQGLMATGCYSCQAYNCMASQLSPSLNRV